MIVCRHFLSKVTISNQHSQCQGQPIHTCPYTPRPLCLAILHQPPTKTSSLCNMTHYALYGSDSTHAHARTHDSVYSSATFPLPALEHGQAKAHFSRGDALSSRGVHMKEQRNIKECPRIHCSAQCEDNLALMENLDQRPGRHNCTFPNKLSATEWARPLDS